MKKKIEIDLFGEHIFVEATVINDAYAVWKTKNLFCVAQKIGAWELEMVIDESYMSLLLEAIEGFACKSEAHIERIRFIDRICNTEAD